MRLFAVRAAAKKVNCNVVIPGVTVTDAWGKLGAMRGKSKEEMAEDVARFAAGLATIQDELAGLSRAAQQHAQSAPLGSAPARLPCLLRARLAALDSSALPGLEGRAPASGARASRLQSLRFHRL